MVVVAMGNGIFAAAVINGDATMVEVSMTSSIDSGNAKWGDKTCRFMDFNKSPFFSCNLKKAQQICLDFPQKNLLMD